MDTIIFESLGGAPTELPGAEGMVDMPFQVFGYGDPIEGALGFTTFGFTIVTDGADPAPPVVPAVGLTDMPFTVAYSFGPIYLLPAEGETGVPFEATGFAGPGAFGLTDMPFEPYGTSVTDDDTAPPPTSADDSAFAPERLALSDSIKLFDTAVVNIVLGFQSAIESAADGETKVAEELMLSLALDVVYRISIAEGLSLAAADTATTQMLERVVDTLLLEGLVSSEADAISSIIEALAAADAADALSRADVTEQLAISGVVASSFTAAEALVQGLLMAAAPVHTGTMVAQVNEAVGLAEGIATELEAFEAITEGVGFVARFHLDTGEYIAWSIGTNNRQLSKYTNFPFNSFAKLGDLYLGCNSEGIFRLEGASDAGEDISAMLRGAMTDMGSMAMKRNPYAYLAYSAPTGLILRTILVNEDGEQTEHVYRLRAQPTGNIREGRIKLGEGPRSVMWGWKIENVDGGELELHALQFKPVALARKMRGKNGGT
ncbi:MAG: hypothetical protein AB7V08_13805 [Elusimicrobiales bacterium]